MEASTSISRIQEKLQQLVKQQQRLRKDNADLQQKLAKSREEQAALATQVQDLQQMVSLLKLAAGSLNDKEKKDFEKQVNKLVRDIDKCIAYLST
jgi:DnaJ-domain-containing protein 1